MTFYFTLPPLEETPLLLCVGGCACMSAECEGHDVMLLPILWNVW